MDDKIHLGKNNYNFFIITINKIINNYELNSYLVGTPGSKRGYSGGPVFTYSGNLAGILLGGTGGLNANTTIQECLDASAEQKYARILGTSLILLRFNWGFILILF